VPERTRKMELAERVQRGVYDILVASTEGEAEAVEHIAAQVERDLAALDPLVRTPTGRERLAMLRRWWHECRAAALEGNRVSTSSLRELDAAVDSFLAWQRQQLEREAAAASRRATQIGLWVELLAALSVGVLLTLVFTAGQKVVDSALAAEMVVANTRYALVAVDRWGWIIAVNQAFEQLVGQTRDRLLRRPYAEACGHLYPLPEVMVQGEPRVGEEVTLPAPGGGFRYFLADAVPWRSPQGKVA
ncbi:MAG: PAS domain-containing protein, partial [Clostridia bacterium]|nr:PAS domain-containing protein [Clostridia bacterium]